MTIVEIVKHINIHNGCDCNKQATSLLQPVATIVAATSVFTVHRVLTTLKSHTQKTVVKTQFVANIDIYLVPTALAFYFAQLYCLRKMFEIKYNK